MMVPSNRVFTRDTKKDIVREFMKVQSVYDSAYTMDEAEFEEWYNNPDPVHQRGVKMYLDIAISDLMGGVE